MTDIWTFVKQGGPEALLFFAIVGFVTGMWVPGYMYKRLQQDYDRLVERYDQLMQMALTGASMAERLTKAVSPRTRN